MPNKQPEVWMRGPLDDMPALVQPVAFALLQAREEVNQLMSDFPEAMLWRRPAGVASPGFHLQHIAGVIDRLFTYAEPEALSANQLDYLQKEGKPEQTTDTLEALLQNFNVQVDIAIERLKTVDSNTLTEARGVGRQQLPSTVMGLYTHAAEHTMRHTGQLLVTVRVLQEQAYTDYAPSAP